MNSEGFIPHFTEEIPGDATRISCQRYAHGKRTPKVITCDEIQDDDKSVLTGQRDLFRLLNY